MPSIEHLCLQIKQMKLRANLQCCAAAGESKSETAGGGSSSSSSADPEFLLQAVFAQALEPPPPQNVRRAIKILRGVAALDANCELTPLGMHLASLPVDVRVGKMIVYVESLPLSSSVSSFVFLCLPLFAFKPWGTSYTTLSLSLSLVLSRYLSLSLPLFTFALKLTLLPPALLLTSGTGLSSAASTPCLPSLRT